MKICFACSAGGHLSQLERMRPWWSNHDRLWVVEDRDDTRAILAGERIVSPFQPTTRNAKNAVRNLGFAIKTLRCERPDVVVSTGAGVAPPFFAVAKLLNIPTVYIEVFGRMDLPTLSGKLCYPMSDLFLLQWPGQQRHYRRGHLIGPLFPAIPARKSP